MLVELIGAIAGLAAIVGVIANNHRRIVCFPIWLTSNLIAACLHVYVGVWSMAARDLIFAALAIYGWLCWRQPQSSDKRVKDDVDGH